MDGRHQSAVDRLYELEIIKGKDDGTFGPNDTLRRADGTVLLMRTLDIYDREHYGEEMTLLVRFADRSGAEIAPAQVVEGKVGYSLYWLVDDYMPLNYKAADDFGSSTVSSACAEYTLVVVPMTQAEIEERIASEKLSNGEMTYEEYRMQDFWLRMPGANERKLMLLFGNTEQYRFSSREEAEEGMTAVTVPVWRIKNGAKVSGTATFQIHAALADEVTAIFTEIYNDPEQFPIADLGGYSWRGDSAWAWDTNPNEGYHDYMHFSYMGG